MKLVNRVPGYILALLLFLPVTVNAEDVLRLSLEQALEIASKNNYSLKAARARVERAEARSIQAGRPYLPTVTLSETMVYTNDPAAAFTYKLRQGKIRQSDFDPAKLNNPDGIADFQLGLEVRQPILNIDADKGRLESRASRKSAEYQLERAGDNIAFEVKKTYFSLVLARNNLQAVKRSINTMRGHDREAEKAYKKGLINRSDRYSTAVRLAELKEQQMIIEDDIRTASDALRHMLRLEGETDIVPVDGLQSRGVSGALADDTPVSERADLKALEANSEAAGYRYEMVKAGSLPRVNAFLQTSLNDDFFPGLDEHSWTLGLNMSWTIYDGGRQPGREQEAKASELESRYAYEEARDRSRFEVRHALRSISTAKSRIAVAGNALKEAGLSLDYTGERYRSGMAMTFELLGREQAYTFAQMRLNKARYDLIVAESLLEYYTGG